MRGSTCAVVSGSQPDEFVRGRLAGDHRPDAAIFGGDLQRHLAAMAHAHIADPLRIDEGQRLGVLGDGDEVLIFQRPAVQQLPPLPDVLDQRPHPVIGVVHLGAVARPGDGIAGIEEALLRPALVVGEIADHSHAAAAIAGGEQHQRERPLPGRHAQPDGRIEAVAHLDIDEMDRPVGAGDRLGDDDVLRIRNGMRRQTPRWWHRSLACASSAWHRRPSCAGGRAFCNRLQFNGKPARRHPEVRAQRASKDVHADDGHRGRASFEAARGTPALAIGQLLG